MPAAALRRACLRKSMNAFQLGFVLSQNFLLFHFIDFLMGHVFFSSLDSSIVSDSCPPVIIIESLIVVSFSRASISSLERKSIMRNFAIRKPDDLKVTGLFVQRGGYYGNFYLQPFVA